MYIEISYDTFDISKRLKELDKNYFVRYNTQTKHFEVWLQEGVNAHLEVVLEYPCLDIRTINKVATTRTDKIEKIIKEMELHNQKLKEKAKQNLIEELEFKVKHIIK